MFTVRVEHRVLETSANSKDALPVEESREPKESVSPRKLRALREQLELGGEEGGLERLRPELLGRSEVSWSERRGQRGVWAHLVVGLGP